MWGGALEIQWDAKREHPARLHDYQPGKTAISCQI